MFCNSYRVPTIIENPGKTWKKVVMEIHGKVMENSKNSEFHGNLFARKKVMEKLWKSVVQIRLIVFLLCSDKVGGADGCKGRRRPLFCLCFLFIIPFIFMNSD